MDYAVCLVLLIASIMHLYTYILFEGRILNCYTAVGITVLFPLGQPRSAEILHRGPRPATPAG